MKFTLDLHKLPFEPDKNQIIYVAGGEKDKSVTKLIELNFPFIRDYFDSCGFTFCYIPHIKYDLTHGERQHYNSPFIKTSKEIVCMVNDNFILDYMMHPADRNAVTPSLLYYHPSCCKRTETTDQLLGLTISESLHYVDRDLRSVLDEIIEDIRNRGLAEVYRKKRLSDDEEKFALDLLPETPLSADDRFDTESMVLMAEIEDRVEKLRLKGVETFLNDKLVYFKSSKLSRVHITKDYHILLVDYFKKIEMGPLPKAVYFLFLRHPEGIVFKCLPDYREELKDIYRRIKPTYGTASSLKSIEDVTDPLDNSINIICSRIRSAFVAEFDDYLARNYYITGKRGEPKRIILPRDLVFWDK
jgi:hypothetical protein